MRPEQKKGGMDPPEVARRLAPLMGDREALLRVLLDDDAPVELRRPAGFHLGLAGPLRPADVAAIEDAFERAGDRKLRRSLLAAIASQPPDPGRFDLFAGAIDDCPHEALSGLSRLRDPRAVPLVAPLLTSAGPRTVRHSAAEALSRIGTIAALDALRDAPLRPGRAGLFGLVARWWALRGARRRVVAGPAGVRHVSVAAVRNGEVIGYLAGWLLARRVLAQRGGFRTSLPVLSGAASGAATGVTYAVVGMLGRTLPDPRVWRAPARTSVPTIDPSRRVVLRTAATAFALSTVPFLLASRRPTALTFLAASRTVSGAVQVVVASYSFALLRRREHVRRGRLVRERVPYGETLLVTRE